MKFFGIAFFVIYFADSFFAKADGGSLAVYFAPGCSISSVSSKSSQIPIKPSGSSFGFDSGVKLYIPVISEKYSYTVSLGFRSEGIGIVSTEGTDIDDKYSLYFVHLSPLGLKLRTDELILVDLRFFFYGGISAKILVSDSLKSSGPEKFIKNFAKFGIDANLSTGFEYSVGPVTSICLGIMYNHSFMNSMKECNPIFLEDNAKDKLSISSNLFGAYISVLF